MRATLLGLLLCVGCGGVAPLGIHDPRLSREAQALIADAEDAVVVAVARVADARLHLREAQRGALQSPALSGDSAAAWTSMMLARSALAERRLELAGAEHALARARLTQTYAETAMRHDLRIYELGPIEAETAQRRAAILAARTRVQEGRVALDEATTRWWTAYGIFVKGGGAVWKPWEATR